MERSSLFEVHSLDIFAGVFTESCTLDNTGLRRRLAGMSKWFVGIVSVAREDNLGVQSYTVEL